MTVSPAVSTPEQQDHKRYFTDKLGISERLMERCLGEALSAGGDYADLYFESVTSTSLGIDEGLVKTASQGISVGCGIRVVSGERTGFAFTDDLSSERLLRAARTAALIASGPAKELSSGFRHTTDAPSLYPIAGLGSDADLAAKLKLIERADKAARDFDSRITQVKASINDELRRILIAASDSTYASDTQPLARLNVLVIAKDATNTAAAGGCCWTSLKAPSRPSTLPARLRARRCCNWARRRLRPARWKWSSAPDGRACCCMRLSATGSRPTSTARRPRRLPD